ncbi:MAG: hypothetical protein ACPG5P_03470, partial [Saprospiraceae bacterium]
IMQKAKSKKQKAKRALFYGLSSLLICTLTLLAFKSPDLKTGIITCESSISFEEKEKTFYKVSASEEKKINDFDKTKMQEKTVLTEVSKCTDSKGNMSTSIIFKNTEDIRESWQPQIGKIEITRDYIKEFGSRGKLIKEIKTTTEDKAHYAKMEKHQSENPGFGLPREVWDFKLTPEGKNKFEKEGYKVEELNNGVIRISNKKIATLYDPVNMSVSNTYFSKGKKESATFTQYMEVGGSYYPKLKTKVRTVTSPSSGACMEVIHQSEYNNYKIN